MGSFSPLETGDGWSHLHVLQKGTNLTPSLLE